MKGETSKVSKVKSDTCNEQWQTSVFKQFRTLVAGQPALYGQMTPAARNILPSLWHFHAASRRRKKHRRKEQKKKKKTKKQTRQID
jgi:hypothetical protein